MLDGLREEGFIRPGVRIDPQSLLDYLMPFTGHPFPETGSAGEFDLYKDIIELRQSERRGSR